MSFLSAVIFMGKLLIYLAIAKLWTQRQLHHNIIPEQWFLVYFWFTSFQRITKKNFFFWASRKNEYYPWAAQMIFLYPTAAQSWPARGHKNSSMKFVIICWASLLSSIWLTSFGSGWRLKNQFVSSTKYFFTICDQHEIQNFITTGMV